MPNAKHICGSLKETNVVNVRTIAIALAVIVVVAIGAVLLQHPAQSPSTVTVSAGGHSGTNQTIQLLSRTQYAPYTYQIYPHNSSTPSASYAGFNITIGKVVNGNVTVILSNYMNRSQNATYKFLASDELYYIDTSLGDDSVPSGEYNLGDDGVALTNQSGYLVKG